MFLFSSNEGWYWGALSEMSQPLFPIGMNTPKSNATLLVELSTD
ncbi:hypothetical protein [Saccharopolyspora erythraea]|nr:hypothetical protein [Saccharopolyspora erythraea]